MPAAQTRQERALTLYARGVKVQKIARVLNVPLDTVKRDVAAFDSYKSSASTALFDLMASSNPQWANLGKYRDQARAYGESSWVYIAVDRVASACALVELHIFEKLKGSKKRIPDSELESLFIQPNPAMTQFEFFYATFAFLLTTGNAYWFLSGAPAKPDYLYLLRPDRMKVVPGHDTSQPVHGYIYEVNNTAVPLEEVEVVHFTLFNPESDYYGMGRLEAAALAVQSDVAMTKWNRNYFGKNNAIPTGILSILSNVNDTEFQRVKQEWRESYGGTERRTAVIRAADVKWQDIMAKHRDMEFQAGRNFNKDEIFQIFGIPPGLFDKGSTQANAIVAMELFLHNTVWPMMVALAQKLTVGVATLYGPNVLVEPEDIRRKAEAAERAEMQAYSSIMTINEMRYRYLNMEPTPWGDIPATGSAAAAITGQNTGFNKVPGETRTSEADQIIAKHELQAETGSKKTAEVARVYLSRAGREEIAQFARYASKGKDVDRFDFRYVPDGMALALKALDEVVDGFDWLEAKGIVAASDRVSASGQVDPFAVEKERAATRLSGNVATALADLQKSVLAGINHVRSSGDRGSLDGYFDRAWWKAALSAFISALYAPYYDLLLNASTRYADMLSARDGFDYDIGSLSAQVKDAADNWTAVWPGNIIGTTKAGLAAIFARWESIADADLMDLITAVQESPLFGRDRADAIAETEDTRAWATALPIAALTLAQGTNWTVAQRVTAEQASRLIPVHTGCVCREEDVTTYDAETQTIYLDYRFFTLKDGHRICELCSAYDGQLFSEILGLA